MTELQLDCTTAVNVILLLLVHDIVTLQITAQVMYMHPCENGYEQIYCAKLFVQSFTPQRLLTMQLQMPIPPWPPALAISTFVIS